jgi:ATP-dependent protease ClpP protease subunit
MSRQPKNTKNTNTAKSKKDTLETKANLERQKLAAEIEQLRLEIEEQKLTNEKLVLEKQQTELELRKVQREEEEALADPKRNGIFNFTGDVEEKNCEELIADLQRYDSLSPVGPITIDVYSTGGNTWAGYRLFDYINELRSKGHYVTVRAFVAQSMAFDLLQVADLRLVSKNAVLMTHETTEDEFGGSPKEFLRKGALLQRQLDQQTRMIAKRGGGDWEARYNRILSQYKEVGNWDMSAEEAVAEGFADAIIADAPYDLAPFVPEISQAVSEDKGLSA